MKRTLLLLCILSGAIGFSQVVANQTDNFQDGTTQNWRIGGAGGGSSPVNVEDGGPAGAGDNCLEYTSFGGGGVASRMIIYSQSQQWSGNFISENIVSLDFDVRVQTTALNLRVAIQGANGTRIASTNAVSVAANGMWTSVSIPLDESAFTVLEGGTNSVASVLSNVSVFRILSSSAPNYRGDAIASTLQIDNVTANATLSTSDFKPQISDFVISPNPAKNKLNIQLPIANDDVSLEIFDVLGKKVYRGLLTRLESSINVSNWKSGVYLVRVSDGKSTQTKRFIKQ